MAEESEQTRSKSGIPYKMYLSRALSAWGDRMWDFGGGLFMMGLMGDDLRLVAIYGFAKCFTLILFGAAIGNWIDRNKRLTSAKVFLALQVSVTGLVFYKKRKVWRWLRSFEPEYPRNRRLLSTRRVFLHSRVVRQFVQQPADVG